MTSKITLSGWLLAAAIVLSAGTASATVHNITIGNNFFSPLGTIVQPGDTVRWIWVGGVPHSTTSEITSPKDWDSGTTSAAGFEFELEFTEVDGPGPFPYFCTVHTGMRDTIFVKTPTGGCCLPPTVGDVNQSGGVDITDISVLIDNQFLTLTPLVCDEEGDVDFSSVVDITDLSILIDNQFLTLAPLSACP